MKMKLRRMLYPLMVAIAIPCLIYGSKTREPLSAEEHSKIESIQSKRKTPVSSIPSACIGAVISTEDKRFLEHDGVDYIAVGGSLYRKLAGSSQIGGMTITQQISAKTLKGDSTLDNIINAHRIEREYKKDEIIEIYLDHFYVNGRKHGIAHAADHYFGKKVEDLDLVECAFIAASLIGPTHFDPKVKKNGDDEMVPEKARYRTVFVLNKMKKNGYIDDIQYKHATQRLQVKGIPFKE